jgi:hypothetical protein
MVLFDRNDSHEVSMHTTHPILVPGTTEFQELSQWAVWAVIKAVIYPPSDLEDLSQNIRCEADTVTINDN